MDVISSILRHTLAADVTNPIQTHFRLGRHAGSAGQEMVWKIYDAVRIKDGKVSDVQIVQRLKYWIYLAVKVSLGFLYSAPAALRGAPTRVRYFFVWIILHINM